MRSISCEVDQLGIISNLVVLFPWGGVRATPNYAARKHIKLYKSVCTVKVACFITPIIFFLCTQVQVFCCRTFIRYTSSYCCHIVSWEMRLTVNRGTELPGINTVRKFPTASYLMYSNLANNRYETICQCLNHERQTIVKYCDRNNQNDTKTLIVVGWVAQSFSNEFLGFKAMIPALSLDI